MTANLFIRCAAAAVLFLSIVAADAVAQATRPAPQTAAAGQVSPEAEALLGRVRQAYAGLESLELAGVISTDLDAGDQQRQSSQDFTAAFQAPNKFRHEVADQLVVGSTGEQLYAFAHTENIYLTQEAPAGRVTEEELPQPVAQALSSQNPSLMLAIQKDPLEDLTRGGGNITLGPDVEIEGQTFSAVRVVGGSNAPQLEILIDPRTLLIRRVTTDMKAALAASGREAKSAQYRIDYTHSKPGAELAAGRFAWTPPQGARDVTTAQQGQADGDPQALVGKPAPAFELPGSDDKKVSLASLKGNVVVLDFWATWCPPCVKSLPHLAELHAQKQESVKVYAVNLMENKELVFDFLDRQGIDVPVLLDAQGQAAEGYRVASIPQTVIIDKEGNVADVHVGFGPDTYAKIDAKIKELQAKGGSAAE